MSTTSWHVDTGLWAAYAAGQLDPVAEASVDAHVIGCVECQQLASGVVPTVDLDAVWQGVAANLSRPRLHWSLRPLRMLGVPEEDLAILAASDGFLLPWAMAVAASMACAVLAFLAGGRQHDTYLLLAPLVPVLAVVMAYDATDALRDLVRTTPYSKLRLALLRTTATLAVAVPSTMLIALVIPGLRIIAFSWLLPALALTTATLLLTTWFAPWTSCIAVATAWATVVASMAGVGQTTTLTTPLLQLAWAALTTALAGVLVVRLTSYRLLGGEG